jgi:hypothetical protein
VNGLYVLTRSRLSFPLCSCFLATYYFINKILTQLITLSFEEEEEHRLNGIVQEISTFVHGYGAYLAMTTCLTYAAALKADEVVRLLLTAAKNDPKHKEVMKQFSKSFSLVFYEPVGAVMQSRASTIPYWLELN